MRKRLGFTLIEMVITLVILGVFSGLAATMLRAGFDSYLHAQQVASTTSIGRIALMRMMFEIKGSSAQNIQSATAGVFRFINPEGDEISFYRSGTDLVRENITSGSSQVLVDNLENSANGLQFTYYQNDGITPTLVAGNIYYVETTLVIEHPLYSVGFYNETMNTLIYLRLV